MGKQIKFRLGNVPGNTKPSEKEKQFRKAMLPAGQVTNNKKRTGMEGVRGTSSQSMR